MFYQHASAYVCRRICNNLRTPKLELQMPFNFPLQAKCCCLLFWNEKKPWRRLQNSSRSEKPFKSKEIFHMKDYLPSCRDYFFLLLFMSNVLNLKFELIVLILFFQRIFHFDFWKRYNDNSGNVRVINSHLWRAGSWFTSLSNFTKT